MSPLGATISFRGHPQGAGYLVGPHADVHEAAGTGLQGVAGERQVFAQAEDQDRGVGTSLLEAAQGLGEALSTVRPKQHAVGYVPVRRPGPVAHPRLPQRAGEASVHYRIGANHLNEPRAIRLDPRYFRYVVRYRLPRTTSQAQRRSSLDRPGPYPKPLHGYRTKRPKALFRPISVRERSYPEGRALLLDAPRLDPAALVRCLAFGSAPGMRGQLLGSLEPAGAVAAPSIAKDACRTSLVPPSCLQPPDLGHAR